MLPDIYDSLTPEQRSAVDSLNYRWQLRIIEIKSKWPLIKPTIDKITKLWFLPKKYRLVLTDLMKIIDNI